MTRRLAALSAAALAAALAFVAPAAAAPDGPDPTKDPRIEKPADKAAAAITRGLTKRIRQHGSFTSAEIGRFAQAAKSGRDIEELSGVPSTPGVKVSEAQLRGLFLKMIDLIARFHDAVIEDIQTAYAEAAANPALQTVGDSAVLRGRPGTGGPADSIAAGAMNAWTAAISAVTNAVRKAQESFRGAGFLCTFSAAVAPTINPAPVGTPGDGVLSVPAILAAGSDCTGTAVALVAPADGTRFGALDASNVETRVRTESGTAPFPAFTAYNNLIVCTMTDASVYTGDSYREFRGEETVYIVDRSFNGTVSSEPLDFFMLSRGFPESAANPFDRPLAAAQGDGTPQFRVTQFAVGGKSFHSIRTQSQHDVLPVVDLRSVLTGVIPAPMSGDRPFNDADFPCGQGPNGFTVCANLPASDPGGDFLVVGCEFGEDVPLDDMTYSYQFGFVFDQDTSTSNNYVPSAMYSGDYYRGSDKWYSLEKSPTTPWVLKVTDARNGGFVAVQSAARAVIDGRVILLGVPRSDFAIPRPRWAVSSFVHIWNYGIPEGQFWSADYSRDSLAPLDPFLTE